MEKQTTVDELNLVGDWWLQVTEYANCEGDYQLRDDFYDLCWRTFRLAAKYETGSEELKYLGDLIQRREGILGRGKLGEVDPHATMSEIVNAVYRAVPSKDKLIHAIVKQSKRRSGRPKKPTTQIVETMIDQGKSNDDIEERTKLSMDNIRQIRSRYKGKS